MIQLFTSASSRGHFVPTQECMSHRTEKTCWRPMPELSPPKSDAMPDLIGPVGRLGTLAGQKHCGSLCQILPGGLKHLGACTSFACCSCKLVAALLNLHLPGIFFSPNARPWSGLLWIRSILWCLLCVRCGRRKALMLRSRESTDGGRAAMCWTDMIRYSWSLLSLFLQQSHNYFLFFQEWSQAWILQRLSELEAYFWSLLFEPLFRSLDKEHILNTRIALCVRIGCCAARLTCADVWTEITTLDVVRADKFVHEMTGAPMADVSVPVIGASAEA